MTGVARVKITAEMVNAALRQIQLHAARDGCTVPTHTTHPESYAKMRAAMTDALRAAAAVAVKSTRSPPPPGWLGTKTLDGYNG